MDAHRGAEQELQSHKLKLAQQLEQANSKIQTQIKEKNEQQKVIHDNELNAIKAMSQQLQQQQQVVEARQQQLKQDTMAYFLYVCDTPQPHSALAFLIEQQLEWPAEAWLFQVLAEYNALPRHEQKLFTLTRDERPISQFNHVRIIEDLKVRFQAA